MDYGELEQEQQRLKSIAALLLSLAALAELLSVKPLALRTLLLPVLRHAEFVAGTFAVDCAGRSLAFPPGLVLPVEDDSCAEAWRLARCLRALASIIGFFACSQDLEEQPPFRGGSNRGFTQRTSAVASRGRFMKARLAMATVGAGRLDTS